MKQGGRRGSREARGQGGCGEGGRHGVQGGERGRQGGDREGAIH